MPPEAIKLVFATGGITLAWYIFNYARSKSKTLKRARLMSLEAAMNEANFEVLKDIRRRAPCNSTLYGWRAYDHADERELSALAQIAEAGDLTWQVWQRLLVDEEDVFLPFARVRSTAGYTHDVRERCMALAKAFFSKEYKAKHGLSCSGALDKGVMQRSSLP
jgi:hypothetical protein